jgi:hypothetical protein
MNKICITCGTFTVDCGGVKVFPIPELTPLEADDSLDSNETVSLNAESLSGLSVRGSRKSEVISVGFPLPGGVIVVEIGCIVTVETVEFELFIL